MDGLGAILNIFNRYLGASSGAVQTMIGAPRSGEIQQQCMDLINEALTCIINTVNGTDVGVMNETMTTTVKQGLENVAAAIP